MNKIMLLVLALIISLSASSQSSDRTIEVSGAATKKVLADEFSITVRVNPGEQCEVPAGKNYQKYIKECKESNKQLMASRENILKGIIESYGSKILSNEKGELQYDELTIYNVRFHIYADAVEFKNKVTEYKDVFKLELMTGECTHLPDNFNDELKLESLKNARTKAEKMVSALGATLGLVKTIYENKPSGEDYFNDYYSGLMQSYAQAAMATDGISMNYNRTNLPDDQGYLSFSASTYVSFYIK